MRSIAKPISPLALPEDRPLLRRLYATHWGVLLAAVLLAAIGLATIHSASSELPVDYLPRQAIWVIIGVLVLALVFSIDYHLLLSLSWPLYVVGLLSLAVVLLIGHEAGGARSWLGIGWWRLQPSEPMKLVVVLVLSRLLTSANRPLLSARQIASAFGVVALPMVLIVLEPDLGGAVLYLPIVAGMMLVAGVRMRTILASGLVLVVVGLLVLNFGMRDYQRARILTYFSPGADPLGAGYQLRQSKIAVGSGQIIGKGFMQGTQSQLRFLPARHTDFVFAVLAEEWGFLGVVVVLGLYIIYIVTGTRIAMRARDPAGILLVVGLLSLMTFHVLYNTAMVIGLVPVTGIPLPYLSYGGSFTLTNFLATGLILGVDFRRYVNR